MMSIEVDNLSKTYIGKLLGKPYDALRNVSFELSEGSVLGVVGANGAGKSTMIKILIGAIKRTSGDAKIFGHDVATSDARKGIGYVQENVSLPEFMTPRELLMQAMSLHGLKKEKKKCDFWLDKLKIEKFGNKPIKEFSKGMTQRVALAHALCSDPKLLILDEPLSGLDPVGRRDVVEILAEFKRNGGSVLLTSHVLHDVERLADSFVLIHQGEVKAKLSPEQFSGIEHTYIVRTAGPSGPDGWSNDGVGRWSGSVSGIELWETLSALRQSGHVLVEVKPVLNLEAVFMRVAAGKSLGSGYKRDD